MLSGREYSTVNMAYVTLVGLRKALDDDQEGCTGDQQSIKVSLLKQLMRYTWDSPTFNIHFYKTAAFLDPTLLTSKRINVGGMNDVQSHLQNEVAWSLEHAEAEAEVEAETKGDAEIVEVEASHHKGYC